jgi:hypothetical protein
LKFLENILVVRQRFRSNVPVNSVGQRGSDRILETGPPRLAWLNGGEWLSTVVPLSVYFVLRLCWTLHYLQSDDEKPVMLP